jgi:hypothetical protein
MWRFLEPESARTAAASSNRWIQGTSSCEKNGSILPEKRQKMKRLDYEAP